MKKLFKSKEEFFIALTVLLVLIAFAVYFYKMGGFNSSADVEEPDLGDYVTSADVEELWPENGPVVATIDGREYRYDPVYLFRLTGCVFTEDPNVITGGGITDPAATPEIINAPQRVIYDIIKVDSENSLENPAVYWGMTMAENAVLLELRYRENTDRYMDRHVLPHLITKARRGYMNDSYTYFHEKYSGLSEAAAQKQAQSELGPGNEFGYNDSEVAYYLLMEKAKFKAGQSTNSYLRQVQPYIKKHSLIASMSLGPDHPEDHEPREPMDKETLMKKYNVQMVE